MSLEFQEQLSECFPQVKMTVTVKKLHADARLPVRANPDDAGYDVFAHRVEDCGAYYKVYSGIAIEPPKGCYFELVPRSSIYKKSLMMHNSIGVIDNGYRGEIVGIFYKTLTIENGRLRMAAGSIGKGESLMQLIPRKQIEADWVEVEVLSETARGEGGFGSSGNRGDDGCSFG